MTHEEFEIIRFQNQDVLATRVTPVGAFSKAYLGEQGRRLISRGIEQGEWRLKPGWEDAALALVRHTDSGALLGLVAEYEDGTFVMRNQYADKTAKSALEGLHFLTGRYLAEEARIPVHRERRGWEEITPGAVIRESFTSRDTITGLWAKNVAVIDPAKCNICQQCGIWCPEDAIKFNPVTGKMDYVDYDYCKGCGMCDFVCPPDQGAISMVEESRVKAAHAHAFHGADYKRIEVSGDYVKNELERISRLPGIEAGMMYEDRSGRKSLCGRPLIQILQAGADLGAGVRPLLYTYSRNHDSHWSKIIRPLTNILVYGMSEYDRELAAGLQSEGFRITAIPAAGPGKDNKSLNTFEKAGIGVNLHTGLEDLIQDPTAAFDAVVTAHYDSITPAQDQLIRERIGVLRAPFLPSHVRDAGLEDIIRKVQERMPEPEREKDDRLLARLNEEERDISAGHRLCTGCVVGTAFNLAVRTMKEMDGELTAVHSGATGCAEVATTIYPDTSWPSFLHTTFGGLGANLEGLNAAYRYLRKRGLFDKKLKFFGWAGDGGTYDIGLQALSGFLERGLATDSVYFCYDNGAYMNTGIQRSSATPMGTATSTSPVGSAVFGKPQLRKDLEHIAGAHRGVYVGRVSPSHQMDFIAKIKKALLHDGPALIVCYSNCTTGHRTDTDLTSEQSSLAVECGYWPLFEIENGETRLSHPVPSAFNPRLSDEHKVKLVDWLRSEGRFAQYFNRDGKFAAREYEIQFREAERQLLADWRRLQAEDRLTHKKDRLMEELVDYINVNNARRLDELKEKSHLFGISGHARTFLDEISWLDEHSGHPKPFLKTVLEHVRLRLDPDAYKIKDSDLKDKLYALFKEEFETMAMDLRVFNKEQLAKQARAARAQNTLETLQSVQAVMDPRQQCNNRALAGDHPIAGRIFARAGDGGVTAAKMFTGLLKAIGLFGKAAPDYGPERRGAPVGTNFIISGREIRTQAGFEQLAISIVVNPEDAGWQISQWRDAVVDGGVIIMNTRLFADDARRRYRIPTSIAVMTTDASAARKTHKVPETVTLMAGVLKSLTRKGISFPEDYLGEQWRILLNKEFGDKANADRIIQANMEVFWETYREALYSGTPIVRKTADPAPGGAGYNNNPPEKLLTGSEAVAEAWRQINPGVFAMFPITPSTEVGETFSRFWADNRVDTEFIHTESEHSSFMTIIAASAAGVRAVTSTASQGMLLGKEGGPLAATLRLPVVVNVGAREVNAPLNIHAGHADFYQFRDDGWMHFLTRNSQEAYDFALIAQKAAERANLPAFIIQDGFIVTHNKDMLDTLKDEQVHAFVGEYDPEFSILKTGGTFNPVALQDYYSEHVRNASEAQKAVPGIIDEVFREFQAISGRSYQRVNAYRTGDAQVAVVVMGSTEGTAMDAVDELRAEGVKAGLLALKVFRPFPTREIREALGDVKTVIVMDRGNSQGTELTPLATEVQAALNRRVLALEYGRGGRNTPLPMVKDIYRLGLVLNQDIDANTARLVLGNPDGELRLLLEELRILEGEAFMQDFVAHLVAGRLIDAFGPWEHFDVRESKKRRAIKQRILEKVTAECNSQIGQVLALN